MADVPTPGAQTPQQCVAELRGCLNACPSNATRSDACPVLFSSDGGVYFNTKRNDPDCQTPAWEQPNVTPRSAWLFAMDGADRAGPANEGLFFGAQDIGTFASGNAASASPAWTNAACCDGFDMAADSSRVVCTTCCFGGARPTRVWVRDANLANGAELASYPAGGLVGFNASDIVARFGSGKYVLATTTGLFSTDDIAANPVTWTQLGAARGGICGVKAALNGADPTFVVQQGVCSGSAQDQLWRYQGTASTGAWVQLNPPAGFGGFGIFAISPTNPQHMAASVIGAGTVQMVLSTDGGANWTTLTALNALMTGNGLYRAVNRRGPTDFTGFDGYVQPTLISFSPVAPDTMLAGAADAGLFLSEDRGQTWTVITDNSGGPSNPQVPRPKFAYFDREQGRFHIYVGTQGRGVWRIAYPDVSFVDIGPCLDACDDARDACMAEVPEPGRPRPQQCVQELNACRARCRRNGGVEP